MLNLSNDKNDDWMKKANPKYREEERKAHDLALRLHKERQKSEQEER